MIPVAIVAVAYLEPEYCAIRAAINACNVPVLYVDRRGIGSLAKAFNDGACQAVGTGAEFLWCVTNVGFGAGMLPRLLSQMESRPDFAAIHPAFASDHLPCQPDGSGEVKEVPFVEFTCPLVRAEALRAFPLDERMPYWGHDLDWGHRVRAAGWKVGVDHGAPPVEHTYIRHADQLHPVTRRRHALRKLSNMATTRALQFKYGPEWRTALGWV